MRNVDIKLKSWEFWCLITFASTFSSTGMFLLGNAQINTLETTIERLEDTKEMFLNDLDDDQKLIYQFRHEGQDLTVEVPEIMGDQEMPGFEYVGPIIRTLE